MKPSLTRRIPMVRRKPMKRVGKRTIAWTKARARLKVAFAEADITSCEVCGRFALSFAHSLPRRMITTDREMYEVALLCSTVCHFDCDSHGHAHMAKFVTDIISNRPNPVIL